MELPPSSIGRDMLIGATISSVSSPQFAEVGTRAGFYFTRAFCREG